MNIKRKIILFNLLIFLLLLEVLVPYVLKEYNIMTLSRYTIIRQDNFKLPSSETEFAFSEEYKNNFIWLIKLDFQNLRITNHDIENAIKIREHLLNLSERGEGNYLVTRYPDEIYKHLKSNKPLLCGELAKLYGYILHLYGFKVRYITVARSLFDSFDRHSTIEIWDERRGKWIISDPTFNISLICDTIFLSSDELYDLIHAGNFNLIKAVHGKHSKYETPIEHYYISYYSLFDNIYYIRKIEPFSLKELPPIRWLMNDYKIFLVQTFEFPVRGSGIKIQNSIMFFILFLNPILIILISFYLVFSIFGFQFQLQKIFVTKFYTKPALIKIYRYLKK
ncbi:MAG: hypothetical protein N3F03_02520 [Ignavibacteria bacterium]|nr:hypothetical protein [Ignavibacteria bacterium]